MNKKYIPVIAFLAAALFFYWIKTKQRGSVGKKKYQVETQPASITGNDFNRNASEIIYSKHAQCRMACRHIDESEVKKILSEGTLNVSKIETSSKGTSYPLEGMTHDGQKVRIVFAPKDDGKVVVVTVIDLEKEFECDCK